jgi:hypothetical protein
MIALMSNGTISNKKDWRWPMKFYHYTTISAFQGIIKNNALWLIERNYMNDVVDEVYIKNKVKEMLRTKGSITFEGSALDELFIDKRPKICFFNLNRERCCPSMVELWA